MGRTFELLKQAEATHFSAPEMAAGVAPNLTEDSLDWSQAVPYVEIGKSALEGSPDVLSTIKGQPAVSRPPAAPPLHRIPHPHVSKLTIPYPVSVSFRPLNFLRSSESKTAGVAAEIVAFHQPDHPVSKEYETLTTAIDSQLPPGGSRVVMLMGAGPGVGTTTVVLNLAFTWARPEKKRIVLVDAGAVATGFSHGGLAKKLGLAPSSLAPPSVAPWSEAPEVRGLQEIKQANLFVLCSANHSRESGQTLSAQGTRDILRQLRKQFDLILIDAPPPPFPLPAGGERHGWGELASGCDGVYLVVPQSAVETLATDELVEAIQEQGIPLGGCVLTNKTKG